MYFKQFLHDDLGCSSYFIASRQSRQAVVVDPQLETQPHLRLPDWVEVFRAHVEGSCGKGMCGRPSTTIGFERRYNPVLQPGRDEFIRLESQVPARPLNMIAQDPGRPRARRARAPRVCRRSLQRNGGRMSNGLKPLGVLVLLLSTACGPMARSLYIAGCNRDIDKATKAIEAARNDGERASGYAERGRAHSEKARYSKAFKLIAGDEYGRLSGLAIEDHDRAIALAPDNAQMYLSRGLTYFDRATVVDPADPTFRAAMDSAGADFTSTIERDGRNARALDMRGLVHTSIGDLDQAIADFALEMTIDPHLGRMRLADAYCGRGSSYHRAGNLDPAISDYEKAIELGASADGCACQPEAPLAWIYYERKQYDRSWEVVRRARATRKWIDPEMLESLKKASGRVE